MGKKACSELCWQRGSASAILRDREARGIWLDLFPAKDEDHEEIRRTSLNKD